MSRPCQPLRQGRHRSRGQALIEMALVVPLMSFLFMGVYTAADLSNAKETVGHAVRAGVRLAAELGNNGYPNDQNPDPCQGGDPKDPCKVDQFIVNAIRPVLSNQLSHAVVKEIDIYQVALCTPVSAPFSGTCPPDNGTWQGSPYKIDRFNGDGTPMSGSVPFTLDLRTQIHPNEASIGVRVIFHYTSPTLSLFTSDETEFAVIRLAPKFS